MKIDGKYDKGKLSEMKNTSETNCFSFINFFYKGLLS